MIDEQYVEHEVKLRVHEQSFKDLRDAVKETRNLLHWILGVAVTSIIIPILMHRFGA